MSRDSQLIELHRPLALALARDFFLPGADRDDVEAEAMFGLWKAIRDYRADGGASFKTFAKLCIRRQLGTAVKAARRGKHEPLTYAARAIENADGETIDVLDLVADEAADPARIVEAREEAFALLRAIETELSPLERRCLVAFANGRSLLEIADELGLAARPRPQGRYLVMHPKAVDNALQRARRKLADPPTERQFEEAA